MHKGYFFVDFDETLINTKSMLSFMCYYFKSQKCYLKYYQSKFCLYKLYRTGVARSEINKAYYSIYKGESVKQVYEAGQAWFKHLLKTTRFFNSVVVDLIEQKRREGLQPVIVSGSFSPCLGPVMDKLGIETAICTALEVKDGLYSGKLLSAPVIGDQKRLEVIKFMADKPDIALSDCAACADHITDTALLGAVGEQYVVPGNEALEKVANDFSWTILERASA